MLAQAEQLVRVRVRVRVKVRVRVRVRIRVRVGVGVRVRDRVRVRVRGMALTSCEELRGESVQACSTPLAGHVLTPAIRSLIIPPAIRSRALARFSVAAGERLGERPAHSGTPGASHAAEERETLGRRTWLGVGVGWLGVGVGWLGVGVGWLGLARPVHRRVLLRRRLGGHRTVPGRFGAVPLPSVSVTHPWCAHVATATAGLL